MLYRPFNEPVCLLTPNDLHISQGICQRSLSRNSVRETIEGANQEAHQGQLLQAFDVSPHIFQFEGFQGQFKEHFKGHFLEQYLKKHFK